MDLNTNIINIEDIRDASNRDTLLDDIFEGLDIDDLEAELVDEDDIQWDEVGDIELLEGTDDSFEGLDGFDDTGEDLIGFDDIGDFEDTPVFEDLNGINDMHMGC